MIDFESFKTRRLAIFVIGLPMLIAILYYSVFAMDRYVSIAQVAVRQAGTHDAPQLPGLAVMLGGINPTSREETLYLREFITSNDMLNVLEKAGLGQPLSRIFPRSALLAAGGYDARGVA